MIQLQVQCNISEKYGPARGIVSMAAELKMMFRAAVPLLPDE